MGVEIVAFPLVTQDEVKATGIAVETGTPPLDTVTVTLVVPNADSAAAPTPNTGVLMANVPPPVVAAPTEKPIEADTVEAPTVAEALTVVAPEVVPAGFIFTEATPLLLVSAAPDVGVRATKVASVLNVTTAFGTGTPVASNTVAFAVVGPLLDTDVVATPAESVNAIDRLGTTVGVPPGVVVLLEPLVPPLPQAVSAAIATTPNNTAKNLYEVFLKKMMLCTGASGSHKITTGANSTAITH